MRTGPRSSTWNSLHALGPVRRLAVILRGARQNEDGTWTLRCAWCDVTVGHEVEIDHVVPRCRGGTDALTNLVPACLDCNDDSTSRDGYAIPAEVWEQTERPISPALRRAAIAFASGYYPWFDEWRAKNRFKQRERDARKRERRAHRRAA